MPPPSPPFYRAFSTTRPRIPVPTTTLTQRAPPIALTPQCPPPTHPPCACDPATQDIDRATALWGTMPRYASHVVIGTGTTDWPSRIEFAPDRIAGTLKRVLKKHGDPFAPVLVTNSSLPLAATDGRANVRVFPQGWSFPSLPTGERGLERWAKEFEGGGTRLDVVGPTVLICSHASRDARCGAYYLPLRNEFGAVLKRKALHNVAVAATSHLGGHKWAGNLVVYMPGEGGQAGWGVWYGRVGVDEVEGIVEETIVNGRVVGGLVRGLVGRELEGSEEAAE